MIVEDVFVSTSIRRSTSIPSVVPRRINKGLSTVEKLRLSTDVPLFAAFFGIRNLWEAEVCTKLPIPLIKTCQETSKQLGMRHMVQLSRQKGTPLVHNLQAEKPL